MPSTVTTPVASVELELTAKCNEQCSFCCTGSGPGMSHGTMSLADWQRVLDEIAALRIPAVQFIGGESTLSPFLPALVEHARDRRLAVEVYSNLSHVRPALWDLFSRAGVRPATSYYSDDAAQHDVITRTRGSHARTRENICTAIRRGIPLRVGLIHVLENQRIRQAEAELRSLGVQHIRVDRVRKVGRAAEPALSEPGLDELCGRCFHQRAAISPDGDVYGCILSRHLVAGSIRENGLRAVLTGAAWAEMTSTVPAPRTACTPDDSNDCDPANTEACLPAFPSDDDEDDGQERK
ncbi:MULTISPECIES: radical SAM protein [Streptomyces]|uniref:Radical SAM core domain-containing protein n=1 Tax=Streptomyces luteosporeus TaxID=173856 RepID=A0ABP6FZ64_9ACTN